MKFVSGKGSAGAAKSGMKMLENTEQRNQQLVNYQEVK
jgi:hypothetical protein